MKNFTLDSATATCLTEWFTSYTQPFCVPETPEGGAARLKRAHSCRVATYAVNVAQSIHLDGEILHLVRCAGLLHDIGRFEQFVRYRTFADRRSVDHGILGVKVLGDNGILKNVKEHIASAIMQSIQFHNQPEVPLDIDDNVACLVKIIRDADKLDIWEVALQYYRNEDFDGRDSVAVDLPEEPHVSSEVYNSLMQDRIVHSSAMKTLNDFRLCQMAWIYDINFSSSAQIIHEKGYLESLRDFLPANEMTQKAYGKVRKVLDVRRSANK
jgi:putative nucleotidyltransferase with HDIG domain